MDATELSRRLEESRRRVVEYQGATIRLLVIDGRGKDRVREEVRAEDSDEPFDLRFYRAAVLASIEGWSGVTEGHILPELGDAPQEFDRGVAKLWLDANDTLFDLVGRQVTAVLEERKEAEKNSPRGSTSSATEPNRSDSRPSASAD